METQPREIEYYRTATGESPYMNWYHSLNDGKTKIAILKRLERIRLGNLGSHRSVGQGIYELKIALGPGYRIYFGQVGSKIIVLLCGGDKSTQHKDINRAVDYWNDYKRR